MGRRPRCRRRVGLVRVAARALSRHASRVRASTCAQAYPAWLRDLEGDRPPLSIDIVGEFLLPILQRDSSAVFIVVDCLRLDQWLIIEPLLAPMFDVERTHYYAVLPTATPYSRNALFSGLFPGEIAARFPDWWGEREDETLNAHERELLEAHLQELAAPRRCATRRSPTASDSDDLERHCTARSRTKA